MNRNETAGEGNEMCIYSQVKEYIRCLHLSICLLSYSNVSDSRNKDKASFPGERNIFSTSQIEFP